MLISIWELLFWATVFCFNSDVLTLAVNLAVRRSSSELPRTFHTV
jgi:hypothetical protein